MRNITFRGAPEEEDFQEVQRKRPRGRPPASAVAQEQAARSLRQGKLIFATRDDTVPAVATALANGTPAGDLDVGMQGA